MTQTRLLTWTYIHLTRYDADKKAVHVDNKPS